MVFFIFIQILIDHEANSGDPDQMPCYVAYDLGLHCLPMSNKNDTRLIYHFILSFIWGKEFKIHWAQRRYACCTLFPKTRIFWGVGEGARFSVIWMVYLFKHFVY